VSTRSTFSPTWHRAIQPESTGNSPVMSPIVESPTIRARVRAGDEELLGIAPDRPVFRLEEAGSGEDSTEAGLAAREKSIEWC